MFGRVEAFAVKSGADHRNGSAARRQGFAVGQKINAFRQARDNGYPRPGKLAGKTRGDDFSVRGAESGSDNANSDAVFGLDFALPIQNRRREMDFFQERGIGSVGDGEDGDFEFLELFPFGFGIYFVSSSQGFDDRQLYAGPFQLFFRGAPGMFERRKSNEQFLKALGPDFGKHIPGVKEYFFAVFVTHVVFSVADVSSRAKRKFLNRFREELGVEV